MVTSITDVNTADTGEFSQPALRLDHALRRRAEPRHAVAGRWPGPAHQGSPTQRQHHLHVYIDAQYEVREYDGWNAGTGLPTGPTIVTREDRPGSYVETLTMSATPHLTGGVPDGTEAISGIQTLSADYTDTAGRVVETDRISTCRE